MKKYDIGLPLTDDEILMFVEHEQRGICLPVHIDKLNTENLFWGWQHHFTLQKYINVNFEDNYFGIVGYDNIVFKGKICYENSIARPDAYRKRTETEESYILELLNKVRLYYNIPLDPYKSITKYDIEKYMFEQIKTLTQV